MAILLISRGICVLKSNRNALCIPLVVLGLAASGMKPILLLTLLVAAAAKQPQHYVNTLTGTQSRYDLSHGNSLPLVARPWGFNSWAPQTDNADGSWFFHPEDVRLFGIRCTHQPSPWIGDYGTFRIQATMHDGSHSDSWQYSSYIPSASQWLPYYWDAHLDAYSTVAGKTHVELTATQHGAVVRVSFPPYIHGPSSDGFSQTRRLLIALDAGQGVVNTTFTPTGSPLFSGVSTQNSGGLSSSSAFGHWFTATIAGGSRGDLDVSSSVLRYGTFVGANGGSVAYFDFDPTQTNASVLTLRVATSLISLNQSQYSLDSEIGSKSFDDVALEGEDEWRLLLGRVTPTVDSGYYSAQEIDDQLTTFYSALYRASLFPRFLDEIAPDGSRLHFSAYDPQGGVFPGISVSDSGFWDAYRTVYPWLSLFSPKTYGRMVTGWTNAFHEGGWLPKWASPGYRGSMVGTMGDVSLADAIVKNIPGIDRDSAWAAIRKDAFDTPSASNRAAPASVRKQPEPLDDGFTSANDPGVGRTCLAPYLQHGYIPRNAVLPSGGTCSEVVSRSLNYMLADAAIAQAAHVLGHDDDAKVLMQRAANYSLLFDAATGFFRSRDAVSGNFTEPFDEFAWGGDYTEAGAWQYRFYVPHDVAGLRALYAESGLDLCDEVERAQTIPGVIHVGAYGTQIHEMTEMAQLCWGQYEHNNQPVHHMLWMPIAADTSVAGKCAQRAQRWLRRVTSTLYKPDADFACGDEDNGQMSAW